MCAGVCVWREICTCRMNECYNQIDVVVLEATCVFGKKTLVYMRAPIFFRAGGGRRFSEIWGNVLQVYRKAEFSSLRPCLRMPWSAA